MCERHPLHTYCHWTENIWYLFENLFLIARETGETPVLGLVLCEESPCVSTLFSHFTTKIIFVKQNLPAGCPKKFVPCLCGNCEGAVDSIISNFTQLHRSSFNRI